MSDYRTAVEDALRQYDGVSCRFERGRKHLRLILEHQGRTRFVVIPGSPSDSRRGVKNALCDVRKELRNLGVAA